METQAKNTYKLYDAQGLADATGIARETIHNWIGEKVIVPCKGSPEKWKIFNESEKERIAEAKRLSDGHPRRIFHNLCKTLHAAIPGEVFSVDTLLKETGRCRKVINDSMVKFGSYTKTSCGSVLPVEMKASVLEDLDTKVRRPRGTAPRPKAAPGKITVNLKGMNIELSREDATRLAEDIIDQL